jgi:hypothetical protein
MLKTYSLPILAVCDPIEVRFTMPTARSRKMRNGSGTRLDANRMWWTMPRLLDWLILLMGGSTLAILTGDLMINHEFLGCLLF